MSVADRAPPLAETLQVLAPDAVDRAFLGICIGKPATIHQAWERWAAERVDVPRLLASRPRLRRLLPLFHWSMSEHGLSTDRESWAILRAAALWEEKRSRAIRNVLAATLTVLDRAGVPVAVLKGTALAETAYPHHALRHCHDIDLLVDETRLSDAQAALLASGFRPGIRSRMRHLVVTHRDGLPVTLHTCVWDNPARPGSFRSHSPLFMCSDAFGAPALVLPRMIMLLQVCTHSGMRKEPGNWTWVTDAVAILDRGDPDPDELTALCSHAGAHATALMLAIRLHMVKQLGVAVSPAISQNLLAVARRNFQTECETVFDTASRSTCLPRRFFVGRESWQVSLKSIRWSVSRRLRAAWNWQ